MESTLNEREIRVLGCLLEKQLATPEYYPLSLNALTNACNQKTNREPVTDYDEGTVEAILDGLIQKKLVNRSMVGRVPKYEELFLSAHHMVPKEAAVLCVLLLRGPQTVGEIRGRTSRLFVFDNIEAVQETLTTMQEWGMVERLPRLPGHKESRFAHLLGGPTAPSTAAFLEVQAPSVPDDSARLDDMEREIGNLKKDLAALKHAFEEFKRQLG